MNPSVLLHRSLRDECHDGERRYAMNIYTSSVTETDGTESTA